MTTSLHVSQTSGSRDRGRGERVTIVGAGLVGCLAAAYLARRGYRVGLYERHGDPRRADGSGGRSLNLTLCERGWQGLGGIGAAEVVRALALPAHGRTIHHPDGSQDHQPYSPNGDAIYSISRHRLNCALLDFADGEQGIELHFGHECRRVDLDEVAVDFAVDGEVRRVEADRLIAADGAFSTVRLEMLRNDRRCFGYSQQFLDQGYKELRLPAPVDDRWPLDPKAVHIWPRGDFMLIAFANLDKSFTLSIHLPFEGAWPSFAATRTGDDVHRLIDESFPDLLPWADRLAADFEANPVSSMVTVRCSPWSRDGRVLLLGDAAHAIVPSYGQGANGGFEDCLILDRCLDRHDDDWPAALAAFEASRKPGADAIAQLSLDHFDEIGDRVGDSRFLLRKQVERRLSERFPETFVPLYEAVSFTTMPYDRAVASERRQDALIEQILNIPDLETRLDNGQADDLMAEAVALFRTQETPS